MQIKRITPFYKDVVKPERAKSMAFKKPANRTVHRYGHLAAQHKHYFF